MYIRRSVIHLQHQPRRSIELKPERLYPVKHALQSLGYKDTSPSHGSVLSRWTDRILFASCVGKISTIGSARPTYGRLL